MVTMKHAVFWDVTPCGSCKNRRYGGALQSVLQLLVTAESVPRSLILFTLMMQAIHSSETSVLTRVLRHHIPEFGIIHNYIKLKLSLLVGLWRPMGL
jgi:hypothetical protein